MLYCLSVALKHWEPAQIKLPSVEQARIWAKQVENYEPRLRGCFGTVDGMLIPLQNDSRFSLQLLYYNGMDKIHAVKQVNVFGMDGTIIAGGTNLPSSYHDSNSSTKI